MHVTLTLGACAGKGGNFIDTAEVYATPMDPSYCGKTEEYIGRWLQKRGCRDEFIIATKVRSTTHRGHTAPHRSRRRCDKAPSTHLLPPDRCHQPPAHSAAPWPSHLSRSAVRIKTDKTHAVRRAVPNLLLGIHIFTNPDVTRCAPRRRLCCSAPCTAT